MDERRRVGRPDATTDSSTLGPRVPARPTGPSLLEARALGYRGEAAAAAGPTWHDPLALEEPPEVSQPAPLSLIGGLLGLESKGALPSSWLRAGDLIAVGSLIAGCTLTALTLGPAGLVLTVAMEAMAAAGGVYVANEMDRPAPGPEGLQEEGATLALVEEELRKARKARTPLSLLLIAPDGEGPVDLEVLRHIAVRARSFLRPKDTLGRQGRECLLVVLPGYGASLGSIAAQQIRLATPPEVTVSIGLASTELAPEADLPRLIKMAAQALYRCARRGGNGVAVARPGGKD